MGTPMLLVETVGAYQLVDHDRRNPVMRHEGYTVTHRTDFVSYRISLGQLRIIAELTSEATDAEWLKYVSESDGDLNLARDSFLSSFGMKAAGHAPAPKAKPTAPAPAPAPAPASAPTKA